MHLASLYVRPTRPQGKAWEQGYVICTCNNQLENLHICQYIHKRLLITLIVHLSEAETARGVGAIVGGSVGGVVIISIMLVLLLTVVIYKRQPKPGIVQGSIRQLATCLQWNL